LKKADLDLIVALSRGRAGLRIDPEKTYLIESRLAPLARREDFGSILEMLAALRERKEDRLAWALVEAMTLNETSFFRDREVFNYLTSDAIPAMARRRAATGGGTLRIWSAGCSTGQEPYSMAMALDGRRGDLGGVKVDLYGSDLSERCLEKAQSGMYTQFEVQRGLPIRQLVDHFEKLDEMWQLSPRIRQMVRWRRINLLADLTPLGQFDVILCRNVCTGLEDTARGKVLESLAARLAPDGVLVLGAAETAGDSAFLPIPGRNGLYQPNPAARAAA
jgi:chemotaxis protein methyltransferase CheR